VQVRRILSCCTFAKDHLPAVNPGQDKKQTDHGNYAYQTSQENILILQEKHFHTLPEQ
jgi:hypothetical protein